MTHRIIFTLVFLFSSQSLIVAQEDTLRLSLPEIVALAQSDAPDVLLAETRMKNRYWEFQSVLAGFRPAISLSGELPDLNRSIDIITLPDGTDIFLQRAQMRNRAGLSLRQSIVPTGGTIFASTGLQRLDIFRESADNITSYYSTPVSIGFTQPIFGFNQMKWSKKIEPLRYQEATRQFAEEMEGIAYQAAQYFFEVFISQLDLEAAIRDKANADTLLNISRGRFGAGRIAETELLQVELSAMNADAAVQEALLALQTGTERLRNYLGIKQAVNFKLTPPTDIPEFELDAKRALALAEENRSDMISFERQLQEAGLAVARAKANSGLQMDVYGVFSLSQTASKINDSYKNPLDNETFQVGFEIPIFDWGKARSRLETALSNRDLTQMNVEQDRVNFQQEILLKVKQFDLLKSKTALGLRAYDISLKREVMTRNRYYIGKYDILDLNIAVSEKENARRGYMNALRAYWLAYYDIRQTILYDFERNVSLVRPARKY
ncbi:MAG: TolC family protein [Saprospiraceae bacterium]|nr:MAG: TolC family protein [Saprospiraceae bacterium]